MAATGNWSANQLAEFLAALSAAENEEEAKRRAVERAAEALGTEVGALVSGQRVETAIGFPPDRVPEAEILALLENRVTHLDVDPIGRCAAVAVPLEGDIDGAFVLARSAGRDFDALETNLLRAMGRVLSLSLTRLRTLATEQERRELLGRLSRIQRSISHHAPLPEVLDAISAGAGELLGDELAGVFLLDAENPDFLLASSTIGVADAEFEEVRRMPVGDSGAGIAVTEERLVVQENYQSKLTGSRGPLLARVQAVIAAPIREEGRVVGALSVASKREGRAFTGAEREALTAFADHASLALTDARLTDQVERALHDPLTGLPNRAFLRDRLEARLGGDRHAVRRVAVLTLDLDRFKGINDRMGPAAGDDLLIAMADRLRSIAGPDDAVARIGSDEFAILAADADAAGGIADAVLAAMEEPFAIDGRQFKLTASIGLASVGASADELLRNSDLAMTSAQDEGGMCCVVYEPRMHSELVERAELGDDLARALERDELEAHFQPKVELSTRRVTGFEALVRWRHPARGLLEPAAFIELAESNGLMTRLTEKVLELSLEAATEWWPSGRRLEVSVNLSPATFDDPGYDLPAMVEELLARFQLPGRALQFELTEEAAMRDDESAAGIMTRLAELGVGLSIDDFGTGYSSLSRLKSLPIDELKIDRSFVIELDQNSGDVPIVRATIEFAHQMGLQIVAEGVETEAAWQCLHELGCERAQGFLIARPLPPDQLDSWLAHWERRHRHIREAARRRRRSHLRPIERAEAV